MLSLSFDKVKAVVAILRVIISPTRLSKPRAAMLTLIDLKVSSRFLLVTVFTSSACNEFRESRK